MAQYWRVPTPTPTPTDSWASYFDSWQQEDKQLPPSEPVIVDGEFPPDMQFTLDMDLDWDVDMQSPFITNATTKCKLSHVHPFDFGQNVLGATGGQFHHDVDAWGSDQDDLLLPEFQIQQISGSPESEGPRGRLGPIDPLVARHAHLASHPHTALWHPIDTHQGPCTNASLGREALPSYHWPQGPQSSQLDRSTYKYHHRAEFQPRHHRHHPPPHHRGQRHLHPEVSHSQFNFPGPCPLLHAPCYLYLPTLPDA